MLLNTESGQIVQTIVTRSIYELYHWILCKETGQTFTEIKATTYFTAAKCNDQIYLFNNIEPSFSNLDRVVSIKSSIEYEIVSDLKFSYLYIRDGNKLTQMGISNTGKKLQMDGTLTTEVIKGLTNDPILI